MFTTRRSFVKSLSLVAGTIPLPGVVKQLCTTLVPEEQTLEDAEDILRGLIARCVNGPIDQKEAKLVASFLARMRPTERQIEDFADAAVSLPLREDELSDEQTRKIPYAVRFITGTVKGLRGPYNHAQQCALSSKPWFGRNFKHLNREVMEEVADIFKHRSLSWSAMAERRARLRRDTA